MISNNDLTGFRRSKKSFWRKSSNNSRRLRAVLRLQLKRKLNLSPRQLRPVGMPI
jgi:hypothetical protein